MVVFNEAKRTKSLLYSSADHKHIDHMFQVLINIVKASGQITFNFKLPRPLHILNPLLGYSYSFINISQLFFMGAFIVKKAYDSLLEGSLHEITDALTMSIIYCFAIYSAIYWFIKRQRLLNFLEYINQNYWHHSLPGLTFVSWYRTYFLIKHLMLIWTFLAILVVMVYGLTPLATGERVLPLRTWYPFDPLQPYVFELVYIQQLLAQIIMGITFSNGSGLFVCLIIVMCGQFDVLHCSLKNLSYYGRLRAGCDIEVLRKEQATLPNPIDDELNQYMYCREHLTDLSTLNYLKVLRQHQPPLTLAKALHSGMVQCVQLHSFLLDACKELEELFNHFCLIKSMQMTLQLCLLVFVVVDGEGSKARILNSIQYFAMTIIELIMFTYFGELLRNHSLRCGEAFWRSQWWTHTTAIRQDVLIFLVNSRRAVKLTAGNFYTMDVGRLRAVVTQAFSFFTLLQKIADKNKK